MPRIEVPTADGTVLEGRFTTPVDTPRGAAVLCHPHPDYGGSMRSWMLPVLQRAFVSAGWAALRFDLRSVADTRPADEQHDRADVAAAVGWARERVDGPLVVGGWSYGARLALLHALDDEVAGWFGVALPVRLEAAGLGPLDEEAVAGLGIPKLFVHGARDTIAPAADVERLVEAATDPVRLRLVEGGDHFLAAHGDLLAAEVRAFADGIV